MICCRWCLAFHFKKTASFDEICCTVSLSFVAAVVLSIPTLRCCPNLGQRDWSKHSGSDKSGSKSTSLSGSQRRLRFGLNDPKSDALVDGSAQNHRTDVAALAISFSRSRRSGTAPSSKTSIDGSATAVSGGPTPANCHSSELNFTGRVTCGEAGAAMSPPDHSVSTPVSLGGIYGLVVSSGCATNSDDLQLLQPDRIDDIGIASEQHINLLYLWFVYWFKYISDNDLCQLCVLVVGFI